MKRLSLKFIIKYSVFLVWASSLLSCSKSTENKNIEINPLDTSININYDIENFMPQKILNHDDILNYEKQFIEIGDEFYSKLYNNLYEIAELELNVSNSEKTKNNKTNTLELVENNYNTFKAIKSLSLSVLNTAWSGKDILELERKKNKILQKYSKAVLDSFQITGKALDKYLYYSYVKPITEEMNKINIHNSIWLLPDNYTEDLDEEFKFKLMLDKFTELHKEGNNIRKVLILNQLKKELKFELINNQTTAILNYWESNNLEFETNSKLLNNFTELLHELKLNLNSCKLLLEKNKEDWNQDLTNDIDKLISNYELAITNEILNLEITEMPQPEWSIWETSSKNQ